jgi:hypothetical protein
MRPPRWDVNHVASNVVKCTYLWNVRVVMLVAMPMLDVI